MRRIAILFAFQLVFLFCYGQKYKVTMSGGSANDGGPPCNGSYVNVSLKSSEVPTIRDGAMYFNTKPTSLEIRSESETSNDQCVNTFVVCSSFYEIPLSLGDCEVLIEEISACYGTTVTLKIEPANFTLTDLSTKAYCSGTSIPLTATPGYGSYTWQYQIKNESGALLQDWSTFTTTTSNSVSVNKSMLPGLDYKEVVAFRYYIGNCGSIPSNVITGYSFLAAPVIVTGVTNQIAPVCLGGTDGYASVFTTNRSPESGETFNIGVYNSKVVPDIDDPNPSNIVNENTLASGTYYALAESNYGNCGTAQWFDVVIPTGPRDALTGSGLVTSSYNGSHINCNGDNNGAITVTASGGMAPYSYSLDGVAFTSPNVLTAGAGTYTAITIHDSCPASNMNSRVISAVTVNDVAAVVANAQPKWCNDNTTSGEISVTGMGGTGSLSDFTYSYDGQPFESSSVKTGLTTGIVYTVVAKDKNGCVSLPADVIIPNPLSGSSSVTNPTCGTGTGTVQINTVTGGTAPYTYSLNGATAVTGSTTNGHTFTGLTSGTNAVTLYDNKGCNTAFSSLAVTIPPLITVSALTTKVSCLGGSNGTITATALNTVGAVQYSLDGGATYQASNQFVNKTIGSAYRVTVKDANSCVMQSGFILVDQIPTLTGTVLQTTNILCHGDTGVKGAALDLTPAGGTPDGDYLYLWSNNATSQDVTGLSAGTYSVTIKDKNLCATTLPNIVVSEPALLSSSLVKTDVSCNPSHGTALSSNGAINLIPAGGTGAYHYNWSTNAVTEDISNLAAGTYDVTITDDNGCTTTNAATLTQPLAVTSLVDTFSDITCKGLNNGSVTILATGGTSVFSYSLNGTAWQGSPVFSGLMPNNYTFYTRDQKGCATQLNKAIAEPDLLVATVVNIEGTTCGNSNGSAQVNVTGGNGSYQYAWKNAFNQIVGTSNVLSDASGDAYTIVVVDSKNCSDTKSALISNSDGAQIQIDAVDPTTCYDTHDGKAAITVSAGAAPYSITWDNDETGLTPIALLPGDNIVRVSDANNCVAVKLVAIPFPDAIAIDTKVITPPTCAGSTDAGVALTMKGGNGSYTYAWSNGSTASLINTVAAGDYGITVKDVKNCTYTSFIKIDAIPELKLSVMNEKLPTCFGGADGALTVGTSGGNGTYSYQWTAGPAAPQIENINAGAYTVKVTDVKGCNLTSTFTLNNPVKFTISIEDKTICVGQKFKIASDIANGSYSWTSTKGFSSTQQEVTLTDPDVYTLKVINAQGCEAQDSFNLITSTELLHADLIMISEAYTADTVVVIDLSWPLPDVTTWLFPTQATVVEENNQLGYAFLQFPHQGQYDVAIRASLGDCVDTYSQAIKIKEGGVTNSGGRQSSMNVIQYFEVYPNPNKGEFTVVTDLYEVQSVRLTLVNVEGNKVLFNQYAEGKSTYNWQVSLPDLTQGTYFLVLKAGKETKAVRMMKL